MSAIFMVCRAPFENDDDISSSTSSSSSSSSSSEARMGHHRCAHSEDSEDEDTWCSCRTPLENDGVDTTTTYSSAGDSEDSSSATTLLPPNNNDRWWVNLTSRWRGDCQSTDMVRFTRHLLQIMNFFDEDLHVVYCGPEPELRAYGVLAAKTIKIARKHHEPVPVLVDAELRLMRSRTCDIALPRTHAVVRCHPSTLNRLRHDKSSENSMSARAQNVHLFYTLASKLVTPNAKQCIYGGECVINELNARTTSSTSNILVIVPSSLAYFILNDKKKYLTPLTDENGATVAFMSAVQRERGTLSIPLEMAAMEASALSAEAHAYAKNEARGLNDDSQPSLSMSQEQQRALLQLLLKQQQATTTKKPFVRKSGGGGHSDTDEDDASASSSSSSSSSEEARQETRCSSSRRAL